MDDVQHDELEHLALMEKLRGMFPMSMIQSSEFRSKYFDRDGRVRYADLSRDSRSFVRDAMTLEVRVRAWRDPKLVFVFTNFPFPVGVFRIGRGG